jgi:hypothetical protein
VIGAILLRALFSFKELSLIKDKVSVIFSVGFVTECCSKVAVAAGE